MGEPQGLVLRAGRCEPTATRRFLPADEATAWALPLSVISRAAENPLKSERLLEEVVSSAAQSSGKRRPDKTLVRPQIC